MSEVRFKMSIATISMRNWLCVLLIILPCTSWSQSPKKLLIAELDRLVALGSDGAWLGSRGYVRPADRDTDLVFTSPMRRVKIDTVLVDRYEISNKDYRAFTNWVQDSITRCLAARADSRYWNDSLRHMPRWDIEVDWENEKVFDSIDDNLYIQGSGKFYERWEIDADSILYTFWDEDGLKNRLKIYPDTTVWEDMDRSLESYTETYFWHREYDDYPVVGITIEQAQAYCHWRTKRLNQSLQKAGLKPGSLGTYRLPTINEREFFSQHKKLSEDPEFRLWLYSFDFSYMPDGPNIGNVEDDNYVQVQSMADDGGLYTSNVKEGYQNRYDLVNTAGNVWEWVSDMPNDTLGRLHIYKKFEYWNDPKFPEFFATQKGDTPELLIQRFRLEFPQIDSICQVRPRYYEALIDGARTIIHDYKILQLYTKGECAKGASWNSSSAAAYPWTSRLYEKGKADAMTGFRIVLDPGENGMEVIRENKLVTKKKKDKSKRRYPGWWLPELK